MMLKGKDDGRCILFTFKPVVGIKQVCQLAEATECLFSHAVLYLHT